MDISIIRFIESQLKTKRCAKYVHKSTPVFDKSSDQELSDDNHYIWPSDKLHRNARDTHHLLNTRFPVSDANVAVQGNHKGFEEYRPNWATEEDSAASAPPTEINPQGRFGLCDFFFSPYGGIVINTIFVAELGL
jgi:hypothetical protein